jgi:hypothetical protein
LCSIKTLLAFKGEVFFGNGIYPILAILHKLVILSGLIAAWYGCNGIAEWCMKQKWFVWLSAFAFMIYAMHAPMVAYATDAVFAFANHLPHYRMLTFIFLPMILITIIVFISALLRAVFPKVYSVITGGRGM